METKTWTNNKGHLKENYIPPERIYSQGNVQNPSTLQGYFEVNGFKYRLDGWHKVDKNGLLFIDLQAYVKSKAVKKHTEESRARFRGYLQEAGDEKYNGGAKMPLKGELNLGNWEYDLSGRCLVNRNNQLSIEFLIYAKNKRKK